MLHLRAMSALTGVQGRSVKKLLRNCCLVSMLACLVACEQPTVSESESFEPQLVQALSLAGLDRTVLVLPRVPYPVAKPARLSLVDKSLWNPPSMVDLSQRLTAANRDGARSAYAGRLLQLLELDAAVPDWPAAGSGDSASVPDRQVPPADWVADAELVTALRNLLHAEVIARQAWLDASGDPNGEALQALPDLLKDTLEYHGKNPDKFRFLNKAWHRAGANQKLDRVATAMTGLLAVVEHNLPVLQRMSSVAGGEWMTPLGKVKVAGTGDDRHTGEYRLLIDLGGNDHYENVTAPLAVGNVSIVIDLAGDDSVHWDAAAGPGAGLLGLGIWVDLAGNDRYSGGSLGLGAGILGAGLLWDVAGDDVYDARAMSQGAGQYGIGMLFDDSGSDRYRSALNGQGYGGSGGFGVLVDSGGDDDYSCAGAFPDLAQRRINRHDRTHYLSLCQGFGFGIRPGISGGVGLLLDRTGNDRYKADIFGQGAAYWFGLGLLVDAAGDDHYEAFEHAQGEGLHLGAGLLSDQRGNDHYTGYEHVQGVGKDRGAGILYERAGNDVYQAFRQSQGAGLASYGVGILVDAGGDDRYQAKIHAQGYAGRPDPGFPEEEWPTGILLDLGGADIFDQPYTDEVTPAGRVQNRQGVAIDYR